MKALTPEIAARFASVALGHVTREYPNHLQHVMTGPDDAETPRALHPVFYGSFDWHSCVHAYWMLARVLRRHPAIGQAAAVRALFDAQLTEAAIAGECAYFAHPARRGFERPYGWAWLLKLAAELAEAEDPRWAARLSPLTRLIVDRFAGFLTKAAYPVRTGTHTDTAFAVLLAAELGEPRLTGLLHDRAVAWYGSDHDCQAWEPGGDAFLSPALVEACAMQRLLPIGQFLPWFSDFLPHLADHRPATLLRPAVVSDRSDGKIVHLDGLNLSRAWCMRRLAAALPDGDPREKVLRDGADSHLSASLDHVTGDYMGEHWLASFAVLALEG